MKIVKNVVLVGSGSSKFIKKTNSNIFACNAAINRVFNKKAKFLILSSGILNNKKIINSKLNLPNFNKKQTLELRKIKRDLIRNSITESLYMLIDNENQKSIIKILQKLNIKFKNIFFLDPNYRKKLLIKYIPIIEIIKYFYFEKKFVNLIKSFTLFIPFLKIPDQIKPSTGIYAIMLIKEMNYNIFKLDGFTINQSKQNKFSYIGSQRIHWQKNKHEIDSLCFKELIKV